MPLLFCTATDRTVLLLLVQVPVPEPGRYRVVLDSDAHEFGGQGRVGHDVDHFTQVGARAAGGLGQAAGAGRIV